MPKQATIEYTPAAGRQIIAVARHTWGRGDTPAEALKALRGAGAARGSRALLYDVPAGAQVDGMGRFTYWPPEKMDWNRVESELGQSPREWAAIRLVAAGKVGSAALQPPPPLD